MNKLFSILLLLGSALAFAQGQDSILPPQTASIFVQDPELFHQREQELLALHSFLENQNEALDSLMAEANRMVKMNDQCASISINDVMGDECWDFYRVELPAFEERYMRVTGEVRLGYMETARGLEDRKKQIDACVEALRSFASSNDQYLEMEGGVFLEPLSEGFQANYNFTLKHEPQRQKNMFIIAQKWGETCREMVVRQDGEGFAPFFLDRLEILNKNMRDNGSRAVYKTDSTNHPVLYLDMNQPIRSAYYLNGVKLFHSRISGGSIDESHLRVHFKDTTVYVDGENAVVKNGASMAFKGAVAFKEKAANMNGRWVWENAGNNEGVDFGPDYDEIVVMEPVAQPAPTEVSAAAATPVTSGNVAAAPIAAQDNGLRLSPFVALSFGFVNFSGKNAPAYGLDDGGWMMMPDVAAAFRVGFGGEIGIYAGVGAMVGIAYGDDLERAWMAPLAQLEVRYKQYGFRETVVIPIPDDYDYWLSFRSGLFATLGVVGVEIGHEFVTNVGQGAYASVYYAW